MAQVLGPASIAGTKMDASHGTDLVAGDVVLGAGWGTTSILAIGTGSNDQSGELTITCDATAAQATATIALTFSDGAYAAAPHGIAMVHSDSAITDSGSIRILTLTTTVLTTVLDVLPVDTKIYVVRYIVVAK